MPSASSDAPVFLVGMMGAGKSTIGAALAAATGRRFVDLDQLVEEWAGESIADFFAAGREQEFRELERSVLRGFDAFGTIVATGGGTVLHPPNLDYMLDIGRVAYLRARPETLAERLLGQTRPLLAGHADRSARLRALLDDRRGAYERAHVTIETDGLAPDAISAALLGWLEAHGG